MLFNLKTCFIINCTLLGCIMFNIFWYWNYFTTSLLKFRIKNCFTNYDYSKIIFQKTNKFWFVLKATLKDKSTFSDFYMKVKITFEFDLDEGDLFLSFANEILLISKT